MSRMYYGAYTACRSVRLFDSGAYLTDVKDHQKFNELPNDFPQRNRFANQLAILREDRNLCDYNHSARAADLVLGTNTTEQLVGEFLAEVRNYLRSKGMEV